MRGSILTAIPLLALAGAVTGCSERTAVTAPFGDAAVATYAIANATPSFTCPATATFTVSDEPSLQFAMSRAASGAVIAVRGMIGITADLLDTFPNVRLTCATPGSGFVAIPGNPDFLFLVQALAPGDAVDNLVLDASGLPEGPYFGSAANLRFVSNIVTCPANGECPFFDAAPGAIVTDNLFTADGSGTGIHLQNGADGSRIERNTIIATAPSLDPRFGGIRARDGSGVVIAHNLVMGPWLNSVSLTFLTDSRIENNDLRGAPLNGIMLGLSGSFRRVGVMRNAFRTNRVSGVGSLALRVAQACTNVFVGNNLEGITDRPAVVFDTTSGANAFVGNATSTLNLGSQDCDGDGIPDPNILTGTTAAIGTVLGMVVSDVMRGRLR
jgi:hypothetical protein